VFLRSFAERFDDGFFMVSVIGFVLLFVGLGSLLTLHQSPKFIISGECLQSVYESRF
jgi:hypothetical protein